VDTDNLGCTRCNGYGKIPLDSISINRKTFQQEDNSFTEAVELSDIITYMEMNLPSSLKKSFQCMWYHGGEGLTSYAKKNVRDAVDRLYKRYKSDE
jgi:hypothetical protein